MLHTMARGSFFCIPADDARVILDRILEAEMDNTLHDETHEAEVDTLPNFPSTLAIPSFEPQKEEIPPHDFMLDIESDFWASLCAPLDIVPILPLSFFLILGCRCFFVKFQLFLFIF